MPKIGDVISPIHSLEVIAWWEKPVKPYGKFTRIVWDESSKKHSAVCKHDYTTGIVAFLLGKAPSFGDVLKVVSTGANTCRVVAINVYHDILVATLEEYEEESDDTLEDILLTKLYDHLELTDEEHTDEQVLQAIALSAWGLGAYKKNGIPKATTIINKPKNMEEEE